MTLMGHALAAVRQGFHVFPVEPLGKTPGRMYPNRPAAEAPWTHKWSQVATNSIPPVVSWWNAAPDYNIGIACAPSGLLVVDCDEGPGKNGLAQWTELVEKFGGHEVVWNTYTVVTGGGGMHFYYLWPRYVQASQSGLAKDVDIRSNGGEKGGYVLAAGSVTAKGSYEVDLHMPVAPAPQWLVELCKERPRPKPVQNRYQKAGPLAFGGLVTRVAMAPEGDRNGCLLWAARAMCGDGAELSDALDLLVPAAVDNGLREREATDTIKSAFRLQRYKDGT